MKEYWDAFTQWGPVGLLLILAVLGIVLSLAGATNRTERKLNGQDEDHYMLRQPLSRVGKPLLLLLIGLAVVYLSSYLKRFLPEPAWLLPAIRVALALIFGHFFRVELAKVVRQRVFVNGDHIRVTPAVGPSIETTFAQIRTVANKVVGRDGGVVGKKIKTKEGSKFEVINTMDGYERFCAQLEEKVELPNLSKKLFKKKDKEEVAVEENWEDAPAEEALPTPSEGMPLPSEGMPAEVGSAAEDIVSEATPAAADSVSAATDEVAAMFPEEAPKEEV